MIKPKQTRIISKTKLRLSPRKLRSLILKQLHPNTHIQRLFQNFRVNGEWVAIADYDFTFYTNCMHVTNKTMCDSEADLTSVVHHEYDTGFALPTVKM